MPRRASAQLSEAPAAVAHAMRAYAIARPAMSAAAFRRPAAYCPERHKAHDDPHALMIDIFEDCGLVRDAAEKALDMLRSLVRCYVLHEIMHTIVDVASHDESFDTAIRVFVTGLPALARPHVSGRALLGRRTVRSASSRARVAQPVETGATATATFVLRASFEAASQEANS